MAGKQKNIVYFVLLIAITEKKDEDEDEDVLMRIRISLFDIIGWFVVSICSSLTQC